MKDFLMQLLSSGTDTPSMMRFAFLFSVLSSNIIVWYVWLFVSIWTRSIVNIPPGVVEIYAYANGAAFLGKGIQSFAERPRYQQMMVTKSDTTPVIPTAKSDTEVI